MPKYLGSPYFVLNMQQFSSPQVFKRKERLLAVRVTRPDLPEAENLAATPCFFLFSEL